MSTSGEDVHESDQVTRSQEESTGGSSAGGSLFDDAMIAQLNAVFERMAQPVELRLYLDDRPVSQELKAYAEELASLSNKVLVKVVDDVLDETEGHMAPDERPCVKVYLPDATYTGLAFHGVPGGHEFTSFVLGLYNAAGPGQPLDEADRASIERIDTPQKIQILVSLSCTMCPDTVVAAQRIASLNAGVSAEAYDINHFPELKDTYQVMSVPCVVVNEGETVSFGKKNLQQMLELVSH